MSSTTTIKRCYICDNVGHLAKYCNKTKKTESTGGVQIPRTNTLPVTRQVTAQNIENESAVAASESSKEGETEVTPLEFVLPDSEEDDTIRQVRISDRGSESQCVCVFIQGVPYKLLVSEGVCRQLGIVTYHK